MKQLSFSLSLNRVGNGERRKGKEKKREGKRKQRNVTNFRVENCPDGGRSRRRARRRGWFSREKRARKERITIYLTDGVDDGVEIDWKLLFFFDRKVDEDDEYRGMRNLKEGSCK